MNYDRRAASTLSAAFDPGTPLTGALIESLGHRLGLDIERGSVHFILSPEVAKTGNHVETMTRFTYSKYIDGNKNAPALASTGRIVYRISTYREMVRVTNAQVEFNV